MLACYQRCISIKAKAVESLRESSVPENDQPKSRKFKGGVKNGRGEHENAYKGEASRHIVPMAEDVMTSA